MTLFYFIHQVAHDIWQNTKPQVLVICHQAVLRCIVGYFLNLSTEEIPYIKIPLHTVIKIAPVAWVFQIITMVTTVVTPGDPWWHGCQFVLSVEICHVEARNNARISEYPKCSGFPNHSFSCKIFFTVPKYQNGTEIHAGKLTKLSWPGVQKIHDNMEISNRRYDH